MTGVYIYIHDCHERRRQHSGKPKCEEYMNKIEDIIDIIACPICKGRLNYDAKKQELICNFDKLAFPIKDNIPVMLSTEAIDLKKRKIHHD